MNPSALERSENAAASAPNAAPPGAVLPCQIARRFAIEVLVEGQDLKPVSGILIRLGRSGSEVCDELSSATDCVRYDGLEGGSYFISCPDLDSDAWQLISEEPLPRATSCGDLAWSAPSPPQAPKPRTIEPGDCLAKIAFELGYAQGTIWNFGPNGPLKTKRKNKYILEPGDILQIPPKRRKRIDAQIGKRYTLRLTDVPEILRVRFVTFSLKPRADSPYLLHVESASGIVVPDRKGSTDGAGFLIESIPPDAIHAEVWFGTGQFLEIYPIDLGQVNPLDTTAGIQSRLRNLSYLDNTAAPGDLDEPTIAAIKRFQSDNQLPATGQPDPATRARLEEVFLS